jgi:hypothetical protein
MMEAHRQEGDTMIDPQKLARRLSLAICVSLGVVGQGPLHAQHYPSRAIRSIVPLSPDDRHARRVRRHRRIR